MNTLVFTGRVISSDKEPLFCCEEIEITVKEIIFKSYPLSLLKVVLNNDGITVDGDKYKWQMLPITIHRTGKHVTKYREIVDEDIMITIEFKAVNMEGKL